nr:hypothetical protein Iba_chr05fCG7180 [Ipomoea batatas]
MPVLWHEHRVGAMHGAKRRSKVLRPGTESTCWMVEQTDHGRFDWAMVGSDLARSLDSRPTILRARAWAKRGKVLGSGSDPMRRNYTEAMQSRLIARDHVARFGAPSGPVLRFRI